MRTKILAASTLAASLMLAACGGGDGTTYTPDTLSGVAAVGVPIVGGQVNVACAGGSALSTTTNSGGAWQVTISGQTLPCALEVSGGTVSGSANSTPYHSIALSFDTVNITPLTDLVVANLVGKAPALWFSGINAAALNGANSAAIKAALNKVNTALGLSATLNGANPLTTRFSPVNGNLIDDILEAIAKARAAAGLDYPALLALAAGNSFSAPTGFNFSSAYTAVKAAGGTETGTGTGTGTGNANLSVQVSVSGITASSIAVGNVPVPSSQSEFCSAIDKDATFTQIGTSAGGSLTINSCSFSGKVGKVNATLTMTSPIVMTVPYAITYTYN